MMSYYGPSYKLCLVDRLLYFVFFFRFILHVILFHILACCVVLSRIGVIFKHYMLFLLI